MPWVLRCAFPAGDSSHPGGKRFCHLIWSGSDSTPVACSSRNGRFWFWPRPQQIWNRRRSLSYVEDFKCARTPARTKRCRFWMNTKKIPGPASASPGIYRLHQDLRRWYAAGLLTRASPYSPGLPGAFRRDCPTPQWHLQAFVRTHSGGSVPELHRLPSSGLSVMTTDGARLLRKEPHTDFQFRTT